MRRSPPSFLLAAALVCAASFLACSAQSPMYAPCTYTSADGSYFDLSPLTRFNAPEDYVMADAAGNSYVINVCGDAMAVPASCVDLEKIVPAPAYQVTPRNDCYWLGQLKGMEWGLINENRPSDGVELYYFDGEPCEGGLTRDVIIKFLCDPLAGAGAPEEYHVLENECHYSVNWPTAYACPSSSAKRSWGIIQMGFFLFVVYTVAGCAFNVVKYGARVGPEAMPHSEFWRDLPNLVREGIAFSVNKASMPFSVTLSQARELLGKKPAGYQQSTDAGDYEWG